MEQELNRKTMVIGHRNPDTDSICSAICYANLKQAVTGEEYMPARAGHVNGETQFVLDYFGAEEPQLVEDVRTQVRDIEIRKTKGVADNISLKRAWNIMQENNVVTIPSVREDGTLEGLITVGDITKTYMNIYDSSILSKANTQYSNIIETLEAELIIGSAEAYFDQGKVLIAAANPDLMEFYIEPHDLVILGNRYESQLCAIEMGADCIIVCEGAAVSMTIKKIAQERGKSNEYTKGTTKVLQEGENGLRRVTLQNVYDTKNILVDQSVLSTEVIKEPVNKKVVEGTKKVTSGTKYITGSGRFIWPVPNYRYCSRWYGGRHKGVDICASAGTPIYASAGGTVTKAGYNKAGAGTGYGYSVIINHGGGYSSVYAHCLSLTVSAGQTVKQGQLIGYLGSTGRSTGNHCHFEIRLNGSYIPPQNVFPGKK